MLVTVLLVLWQVRGGGGGMQPGGGAAAGAGAMGWVCDMVILAGSIVQLIGMWKAFEKAGKPGWAAIVPFYNLWVLVEISGKPSSWFFMILCIPCAGIVFLILADIEVAQKFGQGAGFGVGLALLGIVFWPILGFGSAEYEGGRGKRRRARDEDEDEDEDEDDRPRRRRARDEEEEEDEDDRPRRRKARDEDDEDDEDDRRVRRRPRDDD
jgi:uncharacterized protein DUF5684